MHFFLLSHQEKLVSYATSMTVEVSLRTGVQNIVAVLRQGSQTRAFLLVRLRSLTVCGHFHVCMYRSILPCLACPRSWTSRSFAMEVQALSALPSPTPQGFSVLPNASHGQGVKATSGDLPSGQTNARAQRTHTTIKGALKRKSK